VRDSLFLLLPREVVVLTLFFWSRYCVVGVVLLLVRDSLSAHYLVVTKTPFGQLCALYYYVWIVLLPKVGRYDIIEEVVDLGGGALTSRLVRKYTGRLPEERPLLASAHHD